jgi:tetratricopeptide (TPR) repeat protein
MVEPLIIAPDTDLLRKYPLLARRAAELSDIYAECNAYVIEEALQAIGSALWRSLNADEAFQQAKWQAGQRILHIVIASDEPAILQLPWETLCHPEYGFLACDERFTLSRKIPSANGALPEIQRGPLRILLFSSLPDNLQEYEQLRIEEEQGQVLEALGEWRQSGHIVLEMPDDGRFSEFERLLKEFKPQLLYLSGHGVFEKDFLNHDDMGSFLFEGEHGDGHLVDEKQLAKVLAGTSVQAVILSACQSGKASSANLNNGIIFCLAQHGIPHVIGMRESILDRAVIQFARAFFAALMKGQEIVAALQQARVAISLQLKDDEDAKNSLLASISLRQWCMPMMLCRQYDRPLINAQFTPQPLRQTNPFNESLNNISLPAQFIGRRVALRKWQRSFRHGETQVLLLTGAGGVGKTALAGKLVKSLKDDGYEIFGFSASSEHNWLFTVGQMERTLSKYRTERYTETQQFCPDTAPRADELLILLLEQFGSKVVLFFDNLESVQDETTRALTDPELQIWIDAALRQKPCGLRVVLTSRWALPEWNEPLYLLAKPVYRDFLAVAQQQKLPKHFLTDYKRLRQAYEVLGGNYRALEFFVAVLQNMNANEEQDFLAGMQQAEEKIQANMLLELVYSHRTAAEQELLHCMTAYQEPVGVKGVNAISPLGLSHSKEALEALLSVSLVERYESLKWQAEEFIVSSLVRDWLHKKNGAGISLELLQRAALYQKWLLDNERRSFDQALITHASLTAAGMDEDAHRITLDWIVGPLNMSGLYQTLLDIWLLPVCTSSDYKIQAAGLNLVGKQYVHTAHYDKALDFLSRALAIQQEIGDKSGEGATHSNISQIFKARCDYDVALGYLKKALAIQQEIGDQSGEGATLNNISQIYAARCDYDVALEYLGKALKIQQDIGDQSGKGATLNNISQIYDARSDYDTALEYLQKSLKIRQEIGDKSGEGTTLNNISQIYNARCDYDVALEYLQKSLQIRQEIGDKSGEGVTLNNISTLCRAQCDYDLALEYLQRSLEIRQEIGDKSGEGMTLNNISTLYHARCDYDTALEYLQRSLEIRLGIGDKRGEGATLNNISQIYSARCDYEKALEYLSRALVIEQEIGDKSGEGATLNNISTLCYARCDYDTALEYLQRSLKIRQEIGDKSGEGSTLNNISQIYEARGDYDVALEYLQRALDIQQEIGDKSGEGSTLNNISQIYEARGGYDVALEYLQRALDIQQEIGDKSGEGTTFNNLSQIYEARGDYDVALDYLQKSLEIKQEIGDQSGEGTVLNNISQIFKAQGDSEMALEYLKRSLAIQQEIGDMAGLCATMFNMGEIYWQNHDQSNAVSFWIVVYRMARQMKLAQALQALERLASHLGLPVGLDGWERLSRQIEDKVAVSSHQILL